MSNACPECRHILTSGRKCHQPAMRGQLFCQHHCRTRNLVEANRLRNHSIALPPLEDRSAVQLSIDVVLAALGAGKINRRTAATYVYAIKVGADNLAVTEQAPPPEPLEVCRDERGDVFAAEPSDAKAAPEQPRETIAPLPAVATSEQSSTPDDAQPTEQSGESTKFAVAESVEPVDSRLEDLRNTRASHEYDPEPPIPPTRTELHQKRRQIEQFIKQQREALHYWSNLPAAQRAKENPQMVIDYIQKNINKSEVQLKEISRLESPDPPAPDPPL